jgi:hypothetical protein
MPAIDEEVSRVLPGFLFKKQQLNYGFSDYLAWQVAVEDATAKSFVNFGLPMEGLAVFGNISFILYTAAFPAILMFTCLIFSSMRVKSVMGITLFSCFQHILVESASDGYITSLTRLYPMVIIILAITYKVVQPRIIHRLVPQPRLRS